MRSASATSDDLPATTRRASANCLRTRFTAVASGGCAELKPGGRRKAPPFLNVAFWHIPAGAAGGQHGQLLKDHATLAYQFLRYAAD
jgi:hypothetical protein